MKRKIRIDKMMMIDGDNVKNDNNVEMSNEYEVEEIQGCRIDPMTGQILYNIKWKDYSNEDNTNEPIDCLTGCYRTLKKTLIKEGNDSRFNLNNINSSMVKHYQSMLAKANLIGSDQISGWNARWPIVKRSLRPKVLGRLSNDKIAVLFDNHNLNIVPIKKFLAETDLIGQKALEEFDRKQTYSI